jgi:hypothetical protein
MKIKNFQLTENVGVVWSKKDIKTICVKWLVPMMSIPNFIPAGVIGENLLNEN